MTNINVSSSSNISFDISNLMAIAIAGIIIKLCFGNMSNKDGTTGPASSAIWGYGLVGICVSTILFILFGLATQLKMNQNSFEFIKQLTKTGFPALVFLLLLIALILLNVSYYKNINAGKIPSEYKNLSNVSTILIFIQLIFIFKYLRDELGISKSVSNNKNELVRFYEALAKQMSTFTYLLSVINSMTIGSMYIILTFFTTDG